MRISSRWNTALGISGLNTCWKPTEQDDPMAWEKLGKLHVRIFHSCFCTALENEMPDPASPSWAQQQCGFEGRKQQSIKWIFSRFLTSCPSPQEPKCCMPALPTGPWAFPVLTVGAWLGSVFSEWNTPQDLTRKWILRLNKSGKENMFGKAANKKPLFIISCFYSKMRIPIFVFLKQGHGPFVCFHLNIFSSVESGYQTYLHLLYTRNNSVGLDALKS